MKRKALSKKIRFEVFKRDKFTCQYCGRTAPDVILEVDHIQPVAKGGTNDFLNLITSCMDCNRGKGKRTLTQKDELKKQQKMLQELATRKEQLEMLVEWKKGLESLEDEMVDEIEELFNATRSTFTEFGKKNIKKLIKKYGFEEVWESTRISIDQYFVPNDKDSIEKTFSYVERICAVRKRSKDNPLLHDINYFCKIGRNRYRYFNEWNMRTFLNNNYEKQDFEDIKAIFCNSYNKSELQNKLNCYYGADNDGDI